MSKRSLLIPFIITAISSVLGLILPLLIMKIMDNIGKYIDYKLIIIGVVLLTVSTILSAISTFLLSRVAEKIILKLRGKMWDKTLKLPLKFHQKNRYGELVSRLTNDTIAIVDVMTHELVDLFESIITFIVSLIILFYLDSYLTLVIVVLVPFSLFIIHPLGEKIFNISYKEQERIADLTSFSSGILKDIKMVKAFNAEKIEKNKGENKFQHLYKLGIKLAILNSVITPLLGVFSFIVLIVIVGLGAWRISNGSISIGELVAFILYLGQVVTPFFTMNEFITDYQEAKGSMKRILEVLREEDEIDNQINKYSSLPIYGESSRLDFENVSFAYDADQKVLHNISFSLKTGEIVALIGPSGSGKSTIFSLIERFYPPSSGNIMLNSISYRDVDISTWRKVFSYVPQDFPLFYGTIKDNLLYGMQEKVSMEEIIEATKKANAHEFIMKFPHGYNTHVGEFGNFLSGGQKQRIAITRALLRKSKFILLDEVTANLDSESEYLLQHTLTSLAQNKIGVFMIAHRLSTVKRADKILVLENGRITGYGTHDYLYRTNHHYRDSVDKQKA
jgi:ATP-binding cassette, subfamily B, bacterial AbcA/BmrA